MLKAITTFLQQLFGTPKKETNPIQWHITSKKISFNSYQVIITGTITPSWRLHAQESPLDRSLPTAVKFEKNAFINFKGMPKEEGNLKVDLDKQGAIKICYYEEIIKIIQEVQLYTQEETLTGSIVFVPYKKNESLSPQKHSFQVRLP